MTTRSLTLRGATSRDLADSEAKQIIRFKLEELQRKQDLEKSRNEKSDNDIEIMFSKVPLEKEHEGDDIEFVEGEDNDSDSEWEDEDEEEGLGNVTREYNTLSLKNFARECDRLVIELGPKLEMAY